MCLIFTLGMIICFFLSVKVLCLPYLVVQRKKSSPIQRCLCLLWNANYANNYASVLTKVDWIPALLAAASIFVYICGSSVVQQCWKLTLLNHLRLKVRKTYWCNVEKLQDLS